MKVGFYLTLAVVIVLLATFLFFPQEQIQEEKEGEVMENKLYQGPVPEGYNETHFRQTGETIKLEVKE